MSRSNMTINPIKTVLPNLKKLFIKNKIEFLSLCLIFLISFFMRAYTIQDNLFFGWEQGRDAQIIKNIYTFKHFPLIGPKTDIGGIFHGPYYYYLMTVPYFFGHGNPLVASYFLIFLSSLVSVVFYFLIKDVFSSRIWGFIGGALTAVSYEFISISRWLSNVTPSVLFISLTYLFLWRYHKSSKSIDFLLSILFATLSSQFEINFAVQFIFIYLLLFVFKQIKPPSFREIFFSLGILFIFFSPLVVFDFRNQHISSLTLIHLFTGGGNDTISFSLSGGFHNLFQEFSFAFKRTFYDSTLLPEVIFLALFSLGIFIYFAKETKKTVLFFLTLCSGLIPLLFIGGSLPQLYIGIELSLIGILILSLRNLWIKKKVLFWALSILLFINVYTSLLKLSKNTDVFYTTIQEGMNLKAQREVLQYIHSDAKGSSFFFQAYTVPSLRQEGWDYLRNYYYPSDINNPNAPTVYTAIEKGVYTFWEDRWNAQLGNTRLDKELTFGVIRLQKRERYQ